LRPKVGLGSFAYRYAIGIKNFWPEEPMDAIGFMEAAYRLGYDGVQLCENLCYAELRDEELEAIAREAKRMGLFVELGLSGLTDKNLARHLEIASITGAPMIRVVVGENEASEAVKTIRTALPQLRKKNIILGLENHFDLSIDELVHVVEEIDEAHVGLIFDTTNGLGFLEKPEDSIAKAQPYLVSLHIKDYIIRKVEAGYFITGTVLGEGALDVPAILQAALAAPGLRSLTLEMTIKRDEGKDPQEIVEWEEMAIRKSSAKLQEIVDKFTANEAKENFDD